uniref:Myb-like domain-containing protein n=1 Tax=Macrostomum lignano TaxID=282301 RepID=A0A1I8JPW9_9PLAT
LVPGRAMNSPYDYYLPPGRLFIRATPAPASPRALILFLLRWSPNLHQHLRCCTMDGNPQLFVCNGSAILTMLSSDASPANRSGLGHGQQQQQQSDDAASRRRNRNPSAPFLCRHPPAWPTRTAAPRASAAGGRQRSRPRPQFASRRGGLFKTKHDGGAAPGTSCGGLRKSRRRDAAAASSTATADKAGHACRCTRTTIPQVVSVRQRRPRADGRPALTSAPVRVRAEEAAPDQDDTSAVQIVRRLRSAASISKQQQQQQMMQHQLKAGEAVHIDKLYMGLQRSALRSCAAALRHPTTLVSAAIDLPGPVPLSRPQQFLSNLSSRRSVPQPPPPPQMQQQILRTIRAIARRDFSKDQSRDHSRTRPPWGQQQSTRCANPPPSAAGWPLQTTALVRARAARAAKIAELGRPPGSGNRGGQPGARVGQGSPDPSGAELEDRIRVISREAEGEFFEKRARLEAELGCQIKPARLSINKKSNRCSRSCGRHDIRRIWSTRDAERRARGARCSAAAADERDRQQAAMQQCPTGSQQQSTARPRLCERRCAPPSSRPAQLAGSSDLPSNTKEAFKEFALAVSRRRAAALILARLESMLVENEDELLASRQKPPASLAEAAAASAELLKIFCDQSLPAGLSEPKRSEQAAVLKRLCPASQRCNRSSKASSKSQRRLQCSSKQQQSSSSSRRSNKKGFRPDKNAKAWHPADAASAAEQKPQPPADQNYELMSAAVAGICWQRRRDQRYRIHASLRRARRLLEIQ